MHGLGNDFMVVDATRQLYSFTPAQIQQLADRHRGVGFDQLLLIEPARHEEMDFFYRIFNADGSMAEQCGNGLRCITKFIIDKGLSTRSYLRIGTAKGIQQAVLLPNGLVQVVMGKPTSLQGMTDLSVNERLIHSFSLSFGNPHTVIQVSDVMTAPVQKLGALLNQHSHFPLGVNVSFMQIASSTRMDLRVFERGVGETLACGSGACAAALAAYLQGLAADRVTVSLPGGELTITIASDHTVTMIGPAAIVYEGQVNL